MSILKDYLGNRGVQVALAAVGLLGVATASIAMTSTSPAASDKPSLVDRRLVAVTDDEVFDVRERVDGQLVELKRISDSMKSSWAMSSPYVRSDDKARDIKKSYEDAMRNSPHAELEYTDRYFLRSDNTDISPDMQRTVNHVNAQKFKYLQATFYLQRLQTALLVGKESDIVEYKERLEKATSDIAGKWPKKSEEAFTWHVPTPYRIDLPEAERQHVDVKIDDPAKIHVDIDPARIDVRM